MLSLNKIKVIIKSKYDWNIVIFVDIFVIIYNRIKFII